MWGQGWWLEWKESRRSRKPLAADEDRVATPFSSARAAPLHFCKNFCIFSLTLFEIQLQVCTSCLLFVRNQEVTHEIKAIIQSSIFIVFSPCAYSHFAIDYELLAIALHA